MKVIKKIVIYTLIGIDWVLDLITPENITKFRNHLENLKIMLNKFK